MFEDLPVEFNCSVYAYLYFGPLSTIFSWDKLAWKYLRGGTYGRYLESLLENIGGLLLTSTFLPLLLVCLGDYNNGLFFGLELF